MHSWNSSDKGKTKSCKTTRNTKLVQDAPAVDIQQKEAHVIMKSCVSLIM